LLGSRSAGRASATADTAGQDQSYQQRRYQEATVSIPYRRVETTGRDALATWERLKAERQGWPIIVGGDDDLARIADQWTFDENIRPDDILARAALLKHPEGLRALNEIQRKERADFMRHWLSTNSERLPRLTEIGVDGKEHELPPDEVRKRMAAQTEPTEPPLGEWPDWPNGADFGEQLTVVRGLGGQPLAKVHILVLPTTEAATAPAYLKWGGWNACPPPEYQVAALRSWHDRFGAEPVAISGDVINMRVRRRPATREEALALAREQYLYCEDLIEQGVGALVPLAAELMHEDWWFFWWD
jgi:hypothetical protein